MWWKVNSLQPSAYRLSTFSLMFLTLLSFKCRTSSGYFYLHHTTKTSNMLFVLNSLIKSCHRNKKTNSGIVTWLMTSLPYMWHGKIFNGKCYLVVVCSSSKYKIVKVIKLFKKLPQRFWEMFLIIMIIYFYNYKTFIKRPFLVVNRCYIITMIFFFSWGTFLGQVNRYQLHSQEHNIAQHIIT